MTPDHDQPLSPVYARADAARPRVSQPNSPWTVVAGFAGAVALGVMVFTGLSHGRAAHAQPTPLKLQDQPEPAWAAGMKTLLAQNTAAPPAPVTPAPAPAAPVPTPMTAPPPPDPSEANWKAPAVVVDLADNSAPAPMRLAQTGTAGAPVASAGAAVEDNRLNPDERFAARISNSAAETARAVQLRDLSRIVPQGFVVPATLETAIDSDLPGSVRAVVSRDVRGFDGKEVLIPRGSHIIGQYRSAAAIGQKRAFVIWSRIITPAGVSVDVGSPATDDLGRGGLSGTADSHFFERFGSAILLTVISAAADAAGHGNNNTELVIGSAAQANQVASIALQKQIDIPTTIRVPQGAPVQVSVARDLDFSGVAPYRPPQ